MPLGFPSWTPLLSSLPGLLCPSGLLPKGFSQPVSQVDEVCLPKAHAIGFADPPSLFLQKLKTHFVIAVLKTASSLITSHHTITSHQSFSIPKQQVQSGASLSWLPHQLCHSRTSWMTWKMNTAQGRTTLVPKICLDCSLKTLLTQILSYSTVVLGQFHH